MKQGNIQQKLRNLRYTEITTRELAFLSLFIAITAVATFLHIPGPSSSYFNLGEVAIYIIAIVFGRRAGFTAGAIGSALMDMLLGYYIWAPFTFLIKGIEGYLVGLLSRGERWQDNLLAIIAGGNFMVLAYALTKGFLISWPAVLPEIGIDYMQMLIGGIIALPLTHHINRYFRK